MKALPSSGLVIEGAVTPSFNNANPYVMSLTPGWNQVGNPYNFKILWSEVLSANSTVTGVGSLKKYTGSYVNGLDLDVFEGAFVLNSNSANVSLTIPLLGSLSGGRVATESYDLGADQWVAPITLKVGDFINTFGGVGMHPKAQTCVDDHDDFNPPILFDYAEMRFDHPEHFLKFSTRDLVPTQSEYKWEFTIASNRDGSAEMAWDNSLFGNNSMELFLYDINRGILVDMRAKNSYEVNPKKSGVFQIYFGQNLADKIRPQRIILGEAYPNPGNGNISIPFTLPALSNPVG